MEGPRGSSAPGLELSRSRKAQFKSKAKTTIISILNFPFLLYNVINVIQILILGYILLKRINLTNLLKLITVKYNTVLKLIQLNIKANNVQHKSNKSLFV